MTMCSAMRLLVFTVLTSPTLSRAQEIPVNGHNLFLHCTGSAPGAIVILVAGGGGTTDDWDKLQPQVAAFAKVCSYDRAGLGRSGAPDHPQSAAQIVTDLEDLLTAAHVLPPYILVGHSIGGVYVRRFDKLHDSQVAGIVLIDSAHEEQLWRFAQSEPGALAEYPHWSDSAAMSAEGFLPPRQLLDWHFSKPLIVLEHGIPREPVWHAMQQDLASRSPQGKLITAEDSTHYIHKQQVALVTESIRSVLAQSRSKAADAKSSLESDGSPDRSPDRLPSFRVAFFDPRSIPILRSRNQRHACGIVHYSRWRPRTCASPL